MGEVLIKFLLEMVEDKSRDSISFLFNFLCANNFKTKEDCEVVPNSMEKKKVTIQVRIKTHGSRPWWAPRP